MPFACGILDGVVFWADVVGLGIDDGDGFALELSDGAVMLLVNGGCSVDLVVFERDVGVFLLRFELIGVVGLLGVAGEAIFVGVVRLLLGVVASGPIVLASDCPGLFSIEPGGLMLLPVFVFGVAGDESEDVPCGYIPFSMLRNKFSTSSS